MQTDAIPFADRPARIGVVGAGNVCDDYLRSSAQHPAELEVVALSDMNRAAAEEQASRYGIPKVQEPAALLADPDIELVVNLTPPTVHPEITLQAIAAGKHVFSEKPLAPTLEVAQAIINAAGDAHVAVGCAPATFLGGGLQAARKVLDDGWIGEPIAATAFVTSRGYEHWHPRVESFYGVGGGPMLDVGPYWITTLLNMFGSATRVCASTKRVSETRPRPPGSPRQGDIRVDVSTHVAGTIDFASGPIATFMASWEIWSSRLPYCEVYGSEGTLSLPNPDEFFGTTAIRRSEPNDLAQVPTVPSGGAWHDLPMVHSGDVGRAVAIAEMVDALRAGRTARASAALGYHALEVMLAFDRSSADGAHVPIVSRCERPPALPTVPAGRPIRF
jgi:predicted dehydrogenase